MLAVTAHVLYISSELNDFFGQNFARNGFWPTRAKQMCCWDWDYFKILHEKLTTKKHCTYMCQTNYMSLHCNEAKAAYHLLG